MQPTKTYFPLPFDFWRFRRLLDTHAQKRSSACFRILSTYSISMSSEGRSMKIMSLLLVFDKHTIQAQVYIPYTATYTHKKNNIGIYSENIHGTCAQVCVKNREHQPHLRCWAVLYTSLKLAKFMHRSHITISSHYGMMTYI